MKPLISVIIPAYNAQKYIRQAVESVIQQTTDADIEVLVIDEWLDRFYERNCVRTAGGMPKPKNGSSRNL